jgi:hypothetical protein
VERVGAWFARKVDSPTDGHSLSQFVVGGAEAPPEQFVVKTNSDANARFVQFDERAVKYGKSNAALKCVWAKGEENARRIALIMAASESFDSPVITLSIADYACRLCARIMEDFGIHIVPEIASGDTENKKRKIVAIISESGTAGCWKKTLIQRTRWANVKQRNDLLYDLVESGDIVIQSRGEGVGKGTVYMTASNYIDSLEEST